MNEPTLASRDRLVETPDGTLSSCARSPVTIRPFVLRCIASPTITRSTSYFCHY